MILITYTIIHVLISLVGIFSGLVVLGGLLGGKLNQTWTTLFLITTVATSVTGFFFPVQHFMPSHAVGILSLIILAVAIYARRGRQLAGRWGKVFVVTAMIALYLNVFVLVVQSFLKIPALKAMAPTQTEPPFKLAELTVLIIFAVLTIVATIRFRSEPANATPALAG